MFRQMKSIAAVGIAALAFVAASSSPDTASAACTPGITLSVSVNQPNAVISDGNGAQGYTYSVCRLSSPNRTTTQILRVIDPMKGWWVDGNTQALTPETVSGLDSGAGSYSVPAGAPAGTYAVLVRYYAAGVAQAESTGYRTWKVQDPPVVTTPPAPPVAPVPPASSAPAPLSEDSVPATPRATPVAPAIGLVKSVNRAVARKGQSVVWTMKVSVSKAAASGVKVCDQLPAGLSLTTAPGARFSRGKLCWSLGNMRAGASKTVKFTTQVVRSGAGRIKNVAVASASGIAPVRDDASVRVPASLITRATPGVTG